MSQSGVKNNHYSSIDKMQKLADSRGGKCLSLIYNGCFNNLTWQCGSGHIWDAKPTHISSGRWCRICKIKINAQNKRKYSISDAKEIALKKNGKCLSESLKNATDRLKWECRHGHRWVCQFDYIMRKKTWCPRCSYNNNCLSLEIANNIAAEYNGVCLSKKYVGCDQKLRWRCVNNHTWEATLNNVKNNHSWCPECCISEGEKTFRDTIEKFFGKSFPKKHPDWLKNKKGNNLELDGFNEELKIAFEYQGIQHFEFIPYMHKTRKRLKKIIATDKYKRKMCSLKGIMLLEPNWKMKFQDFIKFIQDSYEQHRKRTGKEMV